MQAMHIHLGQSQDINLGASRNVQGLSNSTESESSFESILNQKINEDLQAKEGPPKESNVESSRTETEAVEQVADESVQEETLDSKNTESTKKSEKSEVVKEDSLEKKLGIDLKDFEVVERTGKVEKLDVSEVKLFEVDENVNEKSPADAETLVEEDSELAEFDILDTEKFLSPEVAVEKALPKKVKSEEEIDIEFDENLEAKVEQVINSEMLESQKMTDVSALSEFTTDGQKIAHIDETDAKESKKVLAEAPQIAVIDERTVSQEAQEDGNFVKSVNYDGNGNATIDLSLNQNGLQNAPGTIVNTDGSVQQHTVSNSQQFGTMLSAEIQSNSSELVKTGSIVLKDGNVGTINLILHPEELGNVKLKLEISDNVLTGKITVASEEAFNAFKENLTSLRQSFEAKGFETSGFDLSWSGKEDSQGQNQQKEQTRNPFGNRYDENMAIADVHSQTQGVYGQERYIDLIA